MKRFKAAAILVGFLSHVFAHAEDSVVFVLESDADGLLQTPVTQQWHGKGFGEDWRHLQVEDSQGNLVPFRFVQHTPPLTSATEDKPLPLFLVTLAGEDGPLTSSANIIRVSPETIEIMLEPRRSQPPTPINQYLVDLRDVEDKPETLVLDWQSGEESRIYPLTLRYSDDFINWQTAGHYALTKLVANDTRLEQNTLALPRHVAKHAYLRITFEPSANVVINALYGRHVTRTQAQADVMQWQVTGALAANQMRAPAGRHDRESVMPVTAWEYQRNERTPASTMFIDFQDRSFIGDIRVLAKNPEDPYWQPLTTATWHHVKYQERWYSSSTLPLYHQAGTQLRLETATDISPNAAPVLRFSAPQWHFQMVANGNSPYRLLRTDAADSSQINQMRMVFSSLGLHSESPATDVTITSEYSPATAPTDGGNWQYVGFWALLIGATVVMLYFVFRLFRAQKIPHS